jgi:pyruvate kinase
MGEPVMSARCEIAATVGPATSTVDQLSRAIEAGASGFRIPLARQRANLDRLVSNIETASDSVGRNVARFLDVSGPKKMFVVQEEVGAEAAEATLTVPVTTWHDHSSRTLDGPGYIVCDDVLVRFAAGDDGFLGDGEQRIRITGVSELEVNLVLDPGIIPPGHYGVTVPGREGVAPGLPILTPDLAELICGVPGAITLLSFVESPGQIDMAKTMLTRSTGDLHNDRVWAKIETGEGVLRSGAIAGASDGVLVGRGDLLMSVGYEQYLRQERAVLAQVRTASVPVMLGTQLWTASSGSLLPHRSELSYLCQRLEDGLDWILLSDETTVGRNPARSIAMIRRLIEEYSPTR